jgi:subtilisin family serine protease
MGFKKISGMMVVAILLLVQIATGQMWYGVDGLIPLTIDSLKVTVKFDDGFSYEELVEQIDRIVAIIPDSHLIDGFVACSLSSAYNCDVFLDSLDTLNGIYLVEPYYLSETGYPMPVGQDFCVAFHENVTYDQIDSINALYKAVIDHERMGRPKVFSLKNTDSSGLRVVELANIYHNLPEVKYAHPDFAAIIEVDAYTLYDYYNEYQPHIKRVIGSFNAASTWDFAGLSRAITVAVIDMGVESHEDLPADRVLPGYDFGDDDADPSPSGQTHGMACAGIIAASHTTDSVAGGSTNSGLISLNPNVWILPVKIYTNTGFVPSVGALIDAIDYARTQGADILSNSWNFADPYYPDIPDLNYALQSAFFYGRNYRGCPVIFSAGNDGSTAPVVKYPARLDVCFAVGAIKLNDSLWYYSSYGDALDIVAPSGDTATAMGDVWALDLMGMSGLNPKFANGCPSGTDIDYFCNFGGTSAACPVVSGTAALILAKDSMLTVYDFELPGVYSILRYSAVTDLDWGSITPPDNQYGYGRVDAFRAILSLSRGDVNNRGGISVPEVTSLAAYLYGFGPEPFPSVLLGDCDCSGTVNMSDVTYLVSYLHGYGPPPVKPCFEF